MLDRANQATVSCVGDDARAREPRTRVEALRLQLADEVVRGLLAPGTALDETSLARRFRVSRTPVREALRLLAASGLVEARAHRPALVARPSEEQLAGMFEVMADLEASCAGRAAERMSAAERHRLAALHEASRALVRQGDPLAYHELNEAFHGTIYAGAHNAYLAELTLATRARLSPFRRAQFRNLGRLGKSYAEHDLVVIAILRGNRQQAESTMRAHVMTVGKAYAAYASAQ